MSTLINAITFIIVALGKAHGAAAGSCDASDYVIDKPRMRVDRVLAAHDTLEFTGAVISLVDKSVNQNACRGSTIRLQYNTTP
ncbi:hypothetical protein [Cryobacterium sp. GrIS_2_6]|uniref:hypothetical protein n=1 Tax=Cryobacterium sp. GrIS_2_6 TaxID=3162785 RepID=UPI002E03C4ED|nr:hypothetical protein [Cryobacterium psychrotolerans]